MLLEGSKAQSTPVVAHSHSRAKVWLIFWSYQDESILKMKGTSSSKRRALIKVFDKDQKMLISIHWIHCILLSIQPHRSQLPWKFQIFHSAWRKYFKGTSSKNPFQSVVQLPFPSPTDLSPHVYQGHKFSRPQWIPGCSLWPVIPQGLRRRTASSLESPLLCYSHSSLLPHRKT